MKNTVLSMLVTAIMGGILISCQAPPKEVAEDTGNLMISPNSEADIATVEAFFDALVAGDEAAIRAAINEDFVSYYQMSPLDTTTASELVQSWTVDIPAARSNQSVETVVANSLRVKAGDFEGDWVLFWGTYKANMNDSGAEIVVPYHTTNLMVNGKISVQYIYYDRLAIMQAQGYELTMSDDD